MAGFLGERQLKNIVLDCDYTLYSKTPELDSKIWDPIEEAQIRFLMGINKLKDGDYLEFKSKFHQLGAKQGYFKTFIDLGGTKADFAVFVKNVDVSQHLAFDSTLAVVLELLAQQVNLYIYSGSPVQSVEKVLDVLLHQQRRRLITGVIGKEFLDKYRKEKTDLAAYQLMLQTFGLKQAETVMVDDLRRSLAVAETVGLATVHINPEKPLQLGNEFSLPALKQILQILKFV